MKKLVRLSFLLLIAVTSSAAYGQNSIQVKIADHADSTLYLIRYYGEKLYYADTAQADKNGVASFDAAYTEKPGMYMIMNKAQQRFEILLNNEDVSIETDIKDPVKSMKIKSSEENKLFYGYIRYIGDQRKLRDELDNQKKASKDDKEIKSIENQIKKIDEDVLAYQKKFVADNGQTLAGKVVNMSLEIEVPEPPKDENGNITDSLFQRRYYIEHYWDNYDLKDEAIIRMPTFQNRLETLYENVLLKHPDSLIAYTDKLMAKIDEGTEVFKFAVVHLTSKYQQSKIMCMDAVFVDMVLKYYKTGKSFWMSETRNNEIVERAETMAPNVCGLPAHNIALRDSADNWPRLYAMDSKLSVLIFWSPDCGHCKKDMPAYYKKYADWKASGLDVEVYTVSKYDDEDWLNFIRENEWSWISTAVPSAVYERQTYVDSVVHAGFTDVKSLNYHRTFDVEKTPTVYIFDENKKIIGKNLDAEGLDKLIRKLAGEEG